VTLAIQQESLHDARSTKCKKPVHSSPVVNISVAPVQNPGVRWSQNCILSLTVNLPKVL